MRSLGNAARITVATLALLLLTTSWASAGTVRYPRVVDGVTLVAPASQWQAPDPTDRDTPVQLIPETAGAKAAASGGVAAAGTQYRYTIHNPSGSYATIRNTRAGYVLGLAANGWTFDVVDRSLTPWYQGTIYGSYGDCGWVLSSNIDPMSGTPHSTCPVGWQRSTISFALYENCASCGQPTPTTTVGYTCLYANVHPLAADPSPPVGGSPIRCIGAGTPVEWRYVTRDNEFVMVKDRSVSNDEGSWSFIPRNALPEPLNCSSQGCAGPS